MRVYATSMQVPVETIAGRGSAEATVTGMCELYVDTKKNPGPLEDQQVLLAVEPSLQPRFHSCCRYIFLSLLMCFSLQFCGKKLAIFSRRRSLL